MNDEISPSFVSKSAAKRPSLKVKAKGRQLAFEIIAAKDALTDISKAAETPKLKKDKATLQKQERLAENQLRSLGCDVEAAVKSAREYLEHESSTGQPVTSQGVGTYRLGNRLRNWS